MFVGSSRGNPIIPLACGLREKNAFRPQNRRGKPQTQAKRQVEGRENPYFPLSAGAFVEGTASNVPCLRYRLLAPFQLGQETTTLAAQPRPALPLLKKKNGYVLDEGK